MTMTMKEQRFNSRSGAYFRTIANLSLWIVASYLLVTVSAFQSSYIDQQNSLLSKLPSQLRMAESTYNPYHHGDRGSFLAQQYSYSTGKNASDSALIIDAMDILYTGKVDGFCIVSSDSDFTRLATRLREAGMKVIGIGEKKTLLPFITACDKFIYIEILKKPEQENTLETGNKKNTKGSKTQANNAISKIDPKIIKLFADSIEDLEDENGWAFLGDLGNLMLKKKPDFDSRNYGFPKMLSFIESMNKFEIDKRDSGKNNIKLIYVRRK